MPEIVVALSVALAFVSMIALSLKLKISKLERDTALATEAERERSQEALRQAESRFSQSLEDQRNSSLSVVIHPFVNTEAENGVFTKQTKVEIGYKYQLMIQGLPCFEPHTMILESTVHKEVDQRTLDFLKSKAEQAAEAAVLVKGGGAAKTAITVAKTVFRLVR